MINKTLVALAQRIVERKQINFWRHNGGGQVTGTISWESTNGFELLADVEAWGPYYSPSLWEPAEQVTYPVCSLNVTTFKIKDVADALLEEGFYV